jgi:hypothetical protein
MSAVLKLLFAFLWAMTPECPTEDSTNCHWDAVSMGNGNGYDFVSITSGNQTVVLKGEWHGVDARGRERKDYPRPRITIAD